MLPKYFKLTFHKLKKIFNFKIFQQQKFLKYKKPGKNLKKSVKISVIRSLCIYLRYFKIFQIFDELS